MAGGERATHSLPKAIVALEVVTPSLEPRDIQKPLKKLGRDFPWALDDGWCVQYWGLRGPGRRSSPDKRLRTCGPRFPSRAPLKARIPCAWAVHFLLALLRPRAGIFVAPSPRAGLGAALARSVHGARMRTAVRVQGRTSSRSLLLRGSTREARIIRTIERLVLARADLVMPMGRFTREIAQDAGVRPERIVELVFPTVWGEAVAAEREDERVDRARVVCAARFELEKGIDVLLRAWSHVVATWPTARLEIAGDGPQRLELERLTHELGLEPHVRFKGWLPAEEMPAFLATALVAVLPSRWEEGLGMVLVEAGLAGCDLVGSDLGGIRDMVEHDTTGRLVPPNDPRALADVLADCLAHPEAALERGAAAREKALEYLSRREREIEEFRERFSALATDADVPGESRLPVPKRPITRVQLLHHADRVASVLRRIGLARLTRGGRSLLGRRVARSLTVEIDGFRLSGDVRHRGHLYRVATGRHEQLTRALFRDAVGQGMVVLDIGAHLGLYSLMAASRTGNSGVVYAFEPDPRTFPLLVENIKSNGLDDAIIPVQMAVSDLSGEECLFVNDSSLDVTGFVASDGSDVVRTSCVTVDEFLPGDRHVDVVKIDIEGAELRALRGMSGTIARASERLTLFVEVHPSQLQAIGSSGGAVLSELGEMGLQAELIDERRGVLRPVVADDLRGERGAHLRCTRA